MDQRCEVEDAPAIAARAERVQFVMVIMQTAERAEIDHAVEHGCGRGQGMSPTSWFSLAVFVGIRSRHFNGFEHF